MSNINLGSSYALERGIDSIVESRGSDVPSLPQLQDSPPCEVATRPHVESLLWMRTLNDRLDEAVRPELRSRELMAPVRFRQGLDRVLTVLREHAEAIGASGGNTAALGDGLAVLNGAIHLLSAECELRDLVQRNRSALYQA